MQAVILAGGQGSRLHPLTLTTPKPLVPLANRPVLEHQLEWLLHMDISDILVLTHYHSQAFSNWLRHWQKGRIRIVVEPVPLGTAGAVANVVGSLHETTVVVNGDNLTTLDLRAMERFHQNNGALATVAVGRKDVVTGSGVVTIDRFKRITSFQEKPSAEKAQAKTINTGTYIIEPAILEGMPPGKKVMWESDVFPRLCTAGAGLYAFQEAHLWFDIGTFAGYFAGQRATLQGVVSLPKGTKSDGIWIEHDALCDEKAIYKAPLAISSNSTIAARVELLGPVCVGSECQIHEGARVANSAIWSGSVIAEGAIVLDSIIGYNCYIGAGAQVHCAVLGDSVKVGPGKQLEAGSRLEPGSIV